MQCDEHLCNISHGFYWHSASRGPSSTAGLLAYNCKRFTGSEGVIRKVDVIVGLTN